MVQPTIEANIREYAMPNTDTGRPIYDNKLPVPMTTKKTVLRDLQNEKRNIMPNSMESPSFLKKNGPETEPVKASTPKKPDPEHLINNSQSINTANGHLVYVRRKPETETPKRNIYVSSKDNSFYLPPRKSGNQIIEEKSQANESPIHIPDIAPRPTCPLTSFPSEKPSVPFSLEKSPNNLQPMGADTRAFSVSTTSSDFPNRVNNQYWEERYCQLQDFLEMLDQSNQENYVQKLRSLSPEGLSSQAIGLEKRSIQLSLEEDNKERFGEQIFERLTSLLLHQNDLNKRKSCKGVSSWMFWEHMRRIQELMRLNEAKPTSCANISNEPKVNVFPRWCDDTKKVPFGAVVFLNGTKNRHRFCFI